MGFSNFTDSAKADGQQDRSGMHRSSNMHVKQASGWYSNRGHRGRRMHKRIGQFMTRYDANGDDKISQDEIDTNRTNNLAKFDTDKDGKLSLSEFQALWLKHNHERMVRSFQRFDKDGDAQVTLDEYKHPLERFVKRHDRNGDGVVSKDDHRRGSGKHRGMHRQHHKGYRKDPKKQEL